MLTLEPKESGTPKTSTYLVYSEGLTGCQWVEAEMMSKLQEQQILCQMTRKSHRTTMIATLPICQTSQLWVTDPTVMMRSFTIYYNAPKALTMQTMNLIGPIYLIEKPVFLLFVIV
jgi:hypothetical protein